MKKLFPSLGLLRTRLILLTLLPLVPIFLVGLNRNLEERRLEKSTVQQGVVATSKLAAASQKNYFEKTRQLLATLSQHSFLVSTTNRYFVQVNFTNLTLLSPDYLNFGLIEKDGKLFSSALGTNAVTSLNTRSDFQRVIQDRRFSVGRFEVDPLVGEPCLNLGYPIFGTDGKLSRVLFASLKLPLLSEALADIPLEDGGISFVLDRSGNILAGNPKPSEWVGKKVLSPSLTNRILASKSGSFEDSSFDGIPRVYAVTPISDGHSDGIFAVVGIPRKTSFARANQGLIRNVAVLGCTAILTLVAAWFFTQRLLLNPINSLLSTADKLSKGDLTARTGIEKDAGELNRLARTVDSMAQNLETRQRELEEANKEIKSINEDLEKRVEARTDELEKLNQELEAFAYSVSHDLRAPIRHISGFVDLLSKENCVKDDAKAVRYMNFIADSSRQMGNLVDDLLSFSRMSRTEMHLTRVRIDRLVKDLIEDLRSTYNGRIITWEVDDDLPEVHADSAMLRLALSNLLANAIKYTNTRTKAEVEIRYTGTTEEHIISVRDNGVGFDMQYVQKLFGVFQRLHHADEFEGTGIGLANVRRIISRHGGRTWAEGKLDVGATFYFSLPRAGDQQNTQSN